MLSCVASIVQQTLFNEHSMLHMVHYCTYAIFRQIIFQSIIYIYIYIYYNIYIYYIYILLSVFSISFISRGAWY